MSRIGLKPIPVPQGVDVKIDNNFVTVKGAKATLSEQIHNNMKIEMADNVITVARPDDKKENRSLHGLSRTLIANMVEGVTNGFKKELVVNGVGYRAAKQGKQLVLNIGYSHPVNFDEPDGITIDVPNPNSIIVSGANKQAVGELAANIRKKRPPEPYKGKGIRYHDEIIRRKEGKAGKAKK